MLQEAVNSAPRPKRRRHVMQYRIQFADEAPAIGSGWRGVAVLKLGRKWVTIVETATSARARLKKAVWAEMPKHVVKRNKLTGEIVL